MIELLPLSVGIGLAVSLLFTELFGIASSGLVVPGYLALALNKPGELVATLLAEGRAGKAAGKGFYDHDVQPRRVWSGLAAFARRQPDATGVPYLRQRILLVQAVEAVRCLEQGILRSPGDGDLAAVLGLGFAPNTGGPFAWLDRQDLPAVVAELDRLAAGHGPRFAPPELLRTMARDGERFYRA